MGLARWAVLAWEHGSKTRGGWFLLMDGERVIGLTVNSFTSGRPYWVACSRDAAFFASTLSIASQGGGLQIRLCLVYLVKKIQIESCYFGVLDDIYLQKFFTRMDCKSRDESNEPT